MAGQGRIRPRTLKQHSASQMILSPPLIAQPLAIEKCPVLISQGQVDIESWELGRGKQKTGQLPSLGRASRARHQGWACPRDS